MPVCRHRAGRWPPAHAGTAPRQPLALLPPPAATWPAGGGRPPVFVQPLSARGWPSDCTITTSPPLLQAPPRRAGLRDPRAARAHAPAQRRRAVPALTHAPTSSPLVYLRTPQTPRISFPSSCAWPPTPRRPPIDAQQAPPPPLPSAVTREPDPHAVCNTHAHSGCCMDRWQLGWRSQNHAPGSGGSSASCRQQDAPLAMRRARQPTSLPADLHPATIRPACLDQCKRRPGMQLRPSLHRREQRRARCDDLAAPAARSLGAQRPPRTPQPLAQCQEQLWEPWRTASSP